MTLQQRVHLRREALEAERDAGQAADVHGVDVRLAALGAVTLTHGRLQLLAGLQQRAQLTCGDIRNLRKRGTRRPDSLHNVSRTPTLSQRNTNSITLTKRMLHEPVFCTRT